MAYLTLAHFYPNRVVAPVFPFPEYALKFYRGPLWRDLTHGLTSHGEMIVEEMVRKGMMVDVTHCTPLARRQILDIVGNRQPVVATHVGAREINPNSYNLTDSEMRRVADTGGMLGVIFMNHWLVPYASDLGIDHLVHTIKHVVNAAGVESVGIGADFDGFTDPPDDLKEPGELPRLTERLMLDGYSREDIASPVTVTPAAKSVSSPPEPRKFGPPESSKHPVAERMRLARSCPFDASHKREKQEGNPHCRQTEQNFQY